MLMIRSWIQVRRQAERSGCKGWGQSQKRWKGGYGGNIRIVAHVCTHSGSLWLHPQQPQNSKSPMRHVFRTLSSFRSNTDCILTGHQNAMGLWQTERFTRVERYQMVWRGRQKKGRAERMVWRGLWQKTEKVRRKGMVGPFSNTSGYAKYRDQHAQCRVRARRTHKFLYSKIILISRDNVNEFYWIEVCV